jgi:hypothetical protein
MRKYIILLLTILLFLPVILASNPPATVLLVSPPNESVSTNSSVTFTCNVTDDENIFNASLYTNSSGVFGLQDTARVMELDKTSDTLLLCHFNDTYTCEDGEEGANTSTDFVAGKFAEGFSIDDWDSLIYPTTNNILYNQGTIEFWVKLDFDPAGTYYTWFFSTEEYGQNKMHVRTEYQYLFLDFYGNTGDLVSAYGDITPWNDNKWHHVAGIWDLDNLVGSGYEVDLFMDGTNESIYYNGNFYSYGQFGDFMYVGSDSSLSNQAPGIYDEFRITNRDLTAQEINESYHKGANAHTDESVNWTVSGIPDGYYVWSCVAYDNESQSTWNDSYHGLTIDATPPVVNYINLTPDSAAEIDPEVLINVTANLTDFSGVDTVIFQYKYDVDWINLTMNNIGGDLWNASFTTVSSERVYYYKIWANDSLGSSNTSETQSVNVTLDYTWTRSDSYLETYGVVSSTDNVGIMRINNTGDDTLIITLSDDWPLGFYYNTTEQFSIGAKAVIDVNITAKYANSDGSYNVTLNISAEPSAPGETASPTYQETTITMNSYSGGPYFDIIIAESPVSVEQSTTGIALNATVKNIGNETAQGTWFNWTLPSGWTNTSGDMIAYKGDLASGISNTSNLIVTVSSSALAGVSTICISANDAGGSVNNSKCAVVGVTCSNTDGLCGNGCTYQNDADCQAPTGGGGSVTLSAAAAGVSYGMSIDAPSRIDAPRGEPYSFHANVSNTGYGMINNISLSVEGYSKALVKISPEIIDSLEVNKTSWFEIETEIPDYMAYGMYNLSLTASGRDGTVTATKTVTLFVHSATESETLALFGDAGNAVNQMTDANFSSGHVEDLLKQASAALDDWDYDNAKKLSEEILRIRNVAFDAHISLLNVGRQISEALSFGIHTEETRKLYALSLSAFERGDYERANERVKNAVLAFYVEANAIVLIRFLYSYWWTLLVTSFVVFLGYRRFKIGLLRKRIVTLTEEEKTIKGMLRNTQSEYFKDKEMGKSEYKEAVHDYESRLGRIKSEKSRLLSTPTSLLGLKASRDFQKQKSHVTGLIRETQKKYFELGTMSKEAYKEAMYELRTELAEIEKNLKKGKKLCALLFFTVFVFASSAFALEATRSSALEAMSAAEAQIREMQELGFGVERANDTLEEARLLLKGGNYAGAETVAKYVRNIKEMAIEANQLIDEVETRVYDMEARGIDVSSPKELFDNGLEAFSAERYEDTKDFLEQAVNTMDEIEAELTISRTSDPGQRVVAFLAENWIAVMVFLVVLAALAGIAYKITGSVRARRKLKSLEKERRTIESLMTGIQTVYFGEGMMSKGEYALTMKKHRSRLNEIKKLTLMMHNT